MSEDGDHSQDPAECSNCFYLLGYECHRRPPILLTGGPAHGVWPMVKDTSWCGEHERDPDA